MAGPMTASPVFPPLSSSSKKRSRRDTTLDFVPASSPPTASLRPPTTNHHHPPKKQRVGGGPAAVSTTIPRTLPTQPHEELVRELEAKYHVQATSVVSSSKINKKVTSVLSHLGHVDLFDPASRPGVIMLHARDKDASKMVTVVELAKRRLAEVGQPWFQYNRVYQVAEQPKTSNSKLGRAANRRVEDETIIEDTALGGVDVDGDEDEDEDAFEPMENAFEQAIRKTPAVEPASTYMSMFLARVPIPELQAKAFMSLQTNAAELGQRGRV